MEFLWGCALVEMAVRGRSFEDLAATIAKRSRRGWGVESTLEQRRGDESNIKPEAGGASDRLSSPLVASLCRQRAPRPVNSIALLLTPADGLYDIREQREEPVRRPVPHRSERGSP